MWDDYEFELDTLTFYADRNADEDTLTFDITMHGIKGDKIDATLAIEIGEGTTSSATKVGRRHHLRGGSGRYRDL